MNSLQGAVRRRWWIEGAAGTRGGMGIAGLDWGGDSPIALLHHANGFCAATLAPLAQLLNPHYRVIAIDGRGQGDSDSPLLPEGVQWERFADDIAAVAAQILDETGHDRIEYGIGSSFGGTVTAIAEARRPGTFARIAMLDPPLHLSDEWLKEAGVDIAVRARARPELVDVARRRRAVWPSREVIRQAWKDKPMFAAWTSEAFDLYINEGFRDLPDGTVMLKCSPEVEAAVFEATSPDLNIFEVVTAVACPTLLVHAGRGYFPLLLHEKFAAQFQNGEFLNADAGHLMPLEVPEYCAELLLAFAGQQPSTPSSTTSSAASTSIS